MERYGHSFEWHDNAIYFDAVVDLISPRALENVPLSEACIPSVSRRIMCIYIVHAPKGNAVKHFPLV
jgi:hypothetical protein